MDDLVIGTSLFKKLKKDLDTAFPIYNPNPDDSLSRIMYLAGQRSVIDYINSLSED
jgi:hypothetical protein|tara:strand:- start:4421 stop:4588 length:168 start_codon:yes stop_codon:yes gene_type:complete